MIVLSLSRVIQEHQEKKVHQVFQVPEAHQGQMVALDLKVLLDRVEMKEHQEVLVLLESRVEQDLLGHLDHQDKLELKACP